MASLSQIQKRVNFLIGEFNYGTKANNVVITDHINAAINDILNRYPFSWNQKIANITLTAGASDLATDYNPKWSVSDARIVNSSDGDDSIFTLIPIHSRDSYSSSDYGFWLTYNTSSNKYAFNSKTLTGTVAVTYNFIPTDLSASTDVCIIPDGELVAYLAASKLYIGSAENSFLKQEYKQEAESRLKNLYIADASYSAHESEGSILDYNPQIRG